MQLSSSENVFIIVDVKIHFFRTKSDKMASKTCEYSEKDTAYVRRLIYDVLIYTLPKCGFPETRLTTECKENVYNRANFLEVAWASTLRVSLIMRDKWAQMFKSRLNSSGFNKDSIPIFLEMVIVCCPLSWSNTTQSIVNASFALCNEIISFFLHEDIDIDPNIVVNAIGNYVTRLPRLTPNISETIEDFFDKFDNVSEYNEWINNFITNFAIPYGSMKDTSEIFFEFVKDQWRNDFKATGIPETLTVTRLRDYVGFLPHDFFEVIAFEESAVMPHSLVLPPGMMWSDESVLSEPQNLFAISESGVRGKEYSVKKSSKSTKVPNQTAQGGPSSKNSSEFGIEDGLEQMVLGAVGTPRETTNALPERKNPKKQKRKKKHT